MRLLYCFWKNFRRISNINGYSNVISGSKNIKRKFCVKILYRESASHEITKKLFMVLVKYHHVPFVWNKYFLTKNIWYYKIILSSTTTMFFLKLSFMSAEDRVNLNNFPVALFIVCQMTQCIMLTMFLSAEKQRSFVSFVSKK